MKHLILPSLILLVSCTETNVTDHAADVISPKGQTSSESPALELERLKSGANPTDVVLEWGPLSDEGLTSSELASRYSWKRRMAVDEITWSAEQQSEKHWRDANWFFQDDGSDDYQVFQSLQTQLGTDQLRMRCTGPTGTKLRYIAECQGKKYEVEYDLKTVQIIKVIANTD